MPTGFSSSTATPWVGVWHWFRILGQEEAIKGGAILQWALLTIVGYLTVLLSSSELSVEVP